MKKRGRKRNKSLHIALLILFTAPIILCASRVNCQAASESDTAIKESVDGIIEEFESALPDGSEAQTDANALSESIGIKNLLNRIVGVISGQGGELVKFILSLVGVALMGALASNARSDIAPSVSRAVGVVASAMMLERLIFLFEGVGKSFSEISSFFAALIPVTLAVNSLGVSPTLASTQAVGMGVTLSAYSFISERLLVPIVSAIFVSSAASSIDPLFERIAKGIKGVFLSFIGIFTVLVGATFSLQSAISSGADSTIMRSARYAVAGSIPIVGNAVSGALGLVSGGVAYARGIIGAGSVAVILTLILSPLVTMLLYRICLKLGIFFASVCSVGGCEGVMASFVGALDTLIAVYSLGALIYIVEMVAFLKGGVGIA